MGQAKRRGTFDERKAQAEEVERQKKIMREQLKADMKQALVGKNTQQLMAIALATAAWSLSNNEHRK